MALQMSLNSFNRFNFYLSTFIFTILEWNLSIYYYFIAFQFLYYLGILVFV